MASGDRFRKLAAKVGAPLAAWIGRRKYGRRGFARLAALGRARAAEVRRSRARG